MGARRAQRWVPALLAAFSCACGDYGGGSSGETSGPSSAQFFDRSAQAGGVEAFETTVYPILQSYCTECHAAGPGSPLIAHPNAATAYDAVVRQNKVSLANPPSSRLVAKISVLRHHTWTGDYAADAAEIAAAIQQWADDVDYGEGGVSVDGALASSSVAFGDGVVDTGDERYRGNLVALYEFKEGAGEVARDTSGVAPALDLRIVGDGVGWLSGWGVVIESGRLLGSREDSRKLYDQIARPQSGTQQYSVEAWVLPANIDQNGPARVVTYSANGGSRNFTLGQVEYNYNVRNRSIHLSAVDDGRNGQPDLQTADADRDLQDRLQHVVVTYDPVRGRRIFVDGAFTGDADPIGGARLWNWDPEHRLVIGAEPGGGGAWMGQVRLLAIYRQALTEAQIRQNYDAGVGERLRVHFDVGQWVGSGSSVEFTVSDFDAYSYLFCQPTLRANGASGTRLANLRILVNDDLPGTGQGFETLDTAIAGGRQELSRQCTVIPKGDAGPAGDRFTLVFEHLAGFQNVVVREPLDPEDVLLDAEPRPREGLRSFARVNASLAAVTGQSPAVAAATYADIREQLPGDHDVRSFDSSNQVAIAKIALEYCDALVESPGARAAYFPGFDFGAAPPDAFAGASQRDLVFAPLYEHMVGNELALQPSWGEVRGELDALADTLLAGCSDLSCDAERTRTIVKATCAALASSAAVSLH